MIDVKLAKPKTLLGTKRRQKQGAPKGAGQSRETNPKERDHIGTYAESYAFSG